MLREHFHSFIKDPSTARYQTGTVQATENPINRAQCSLAALEGAKYSTAKTLSSRLRGQFRVPKRAIIKVKSSWGSWGKVLCECDNIYTLNAEGYVNDRK